MSNQHKNTGNYPYCSLANSHEANKEHFPVLLSLVFSKYYSIFRFDGLCSVQNDLIKEESSHKVHGPVHVPYGSACVSSNRAHQPIPSHICLVSDMSSAACRFNSHISTNLSQCFVPEILSEFNILIQVNVVRVHSYKVVYVQMTPMYTHATRQDAVLGVDPCFCSQGSLMGGSGDHKGCQRLSPG